MNQTSLRACINDISFLPGEEFSLLMGCAVKRTLAKGTPLLKEGDICRSIFLVETGFLRTWYNKNETAINLHFAFEGEFTSNLKSMKFRTGSDYIIEAGSRSSVWIFNLDILGKYATTHPLINLFIRRLAVRLLLASEEHSNLFKIYTPAERYHYIEKNKPSLLQRIPLSQLASYLGVARETISRIRAKSRVS